RLKVSDSNKVLCTAKHLRQNRDPPECRFRPSASGPAQVVQLGHRALRQLFASDDGAISSPPAPYHLSAGGNRIRTIGPPIGRMVFVRRKTAETMAEHGRPGARWP